MLKNLLIFADSAPAVSDTSYLMPLILLGVAGIAIIAITFFMKKK